MADVLFFRHRNPRQFRRVDRQLTDLTDEEVRQRYRLSSAGIDRLERLVGHELARRTRRNQALTPRQQLLIALRFYATGNFLQVIGDTFGVDIATVSRVVTVVTDILFRLKDRVIAFPTSDADRRRTMTGFFKVADFPLVIGCIDGTHVRIISPGVVDEAAYVNRKHYHSINVQATCDDQGLFTSMNACWPGSCHDAHVFRSSNLSDHLEQHHRDPERGILLGDSGYPCRPYLMTPYNSPANDAEERFNRAHIATRNIVERTFGVWKRTFHVLHGEIRMKPRKVSRVIVACAVLHNLRVRWKEPAFGPDALIDEQPDMVAFAGNQDGKGVRGHITRTYFNN